MTKTVAALAAFALLCAPLSALADSAPASAAAQAQLSVASPIKNLIANPATKAILDKHLPGMSAHPALPMFQDLTLAQAMPASEGHITPEIIAAIQADIDALPAS